MKNQVAQITNIEGYHTTQFNIVISIEFIDCQKM